MEKKIQNYCRELKIEYSGIATYAEKSMIVCLFPYYVGNEKGNLAKYARSKDYHSIVHQYLQQIEDFAKRCGIQTHGTYCDSNDYPERYIATLAGLGIIGKNRCLINEKYGSYVFVGMVACEQVLIPSQPKLENCMGCLCCEKSCPGSALSKDGLAKDLCGSAISQEKGEISPTQMNILSASGYIWGCDICQDVCPHNENALVTPLQAFYQDRICSLSDLMQMSNQVFKEQYGAYAFAWRGKKPLERNICLKEQDEKMVKRTF